MNKTNFDLNNFVNNKKVLVFGLGVSGLSAIRFLSSQKAQIWAVNSGSVDSWATQEVLQYLDKSQCFSENDPQLNMVLNEIELVILSPGIPGDHPLLKDNPHFQSIPIWGELELAYRYLEMTNQLKPIIGITGTNGKTTTTTFLGEMIEASGKKVFVGGNIGVPFCDYALDVYNSKPASDFILLELSSFQLESLDHFHVDIAIILNLYQNHGERYEKIEDYGRSKFNITNRFTDRDVLIYPENFPLIAVWASTQVGIKFCVHTDHPTKNPMTDYDLTKFKLPGIHNLVNLNFILLAAGVLKLPKSAIQYSIDHFAGVHHRIEYVSDVSGFAQSVVAFNDAKSTNWDATITAVKAMESLPGQLFLIIGGKKRGHGDSIIPYLDFLKTRVHQFYLIGEMAQEIEAELKGIVDYKLTNTLEETLKDMRSLKSSEQAILLFSPGFPSFDQFKNYSHRGEHYMNLLRNL
jgi:UDP-N-acetylmuramoylalanine--D-glutamate ligase